MSSFPGGTHASGLACSGDLAPLVLFRPHAALPTSTSSVSGGAGDVTRIAVRTKVLMSWKMMIQGPDLPFVTASLLIEQRGIFAERFQEPGIYEHCAELTWTLEYFYALGDYRLEPALHDGARSGLKL